MSFSPCVCPACRHRAEPWQRFCMACGAAIPTTCPACGRPVEAGWSFCSGCRAPLQQPTPEPPPPPPPRARRSRRILLPIAVAAALLLSALGVVALLALASGHLELLPAMLASAVTNGPAGRLQPAPIADTGAPAFRIEPAPGLRLQAPANALDRPRDFSARELSADDLRALPAPATPPGGLVLGGWQLDCGMSADDIFPRDVSVSVDLDRLGVPRGMRDCADLAHVAEDGTVTPLTITVDGKHLTTSIRHNGFLVVRLIVIWLPVAGYTVSYAWQKDRADLPQGSFVDMPWRPGETRFILHWPDHWQPRNPQAEVETTALLLSAMKRHPPPGAGQDAPILRLPPDASSDQVKLALLKTMLDAARTGMSYGDWVQALDRDDDYREFMRRARDPKWLLENVLPIKVGHSVRALERAADYLEGRDFRKPGVARMSIPVHTYIYETGGGEYGEAANCWTTHPYMVINAGMVSPLDACYFLDDAPPPLRAVANPPSPYKRRIFKEQFDDLQLTLLHELFHLVQGAYNLYASPDYMWFDEATAVLLEIEGAEDYTKAGFITSKNLTTDRTMAFVFSELDRKVPWKAWQGASEEEQKAVQAHGYGASFFLEALRDRYYWAQSRKFLPTLMEDFASFRGGTIASLYRVTSKSEEGLGADYERFVLQHAEELWALAASQPSGGAGARKSAALDRMSTYRFWLFRPWRPLSASFMELHTPGAIGGREERPVYCLHTRGFGELGVSVWRSPSGGGKWAELPAQGCVLPRERTHRLVRVQKYLATPDALASTSEAGIDGQGPVAFGMERLGPPTASIDGETLLIDWSPSINAKLLANGERLLIDAWVLTLHLPGGRVLNFRNDEPRAELPIKLVRDMVLKERKEGLSRMWQLIGGSQIGRQDIGPLIEIAEAWTASDAANIGFSFREVGKVGGRPQGPRSRIALLELDDEAALGFGISGRWLGKPPFSGGQMIRLDLNETSGGALEGTMYLGSDMLPLRGTPHAGARTWTFLMREENLWYPAIFTLQKLPGNRLYLTAPPCLLKRTATGPVTLEWEHRADEMDWKQLLWLLASELRALEAKGTTGGGEAE